MNNEENTLQNINEEIILENFIKEELPEYIKKGYISEEYMNWFESELDYHLLRVFDINSESLIVDIGCYNGTWLKDMYCKYNCNCIGVEPVKKYYDQSSRILVDDKIKIYNFALSIIKNKEIKMIDKKDSSCISLEDEGNIVPSRYAKTFFESINTKIDVLQINIEGYEYELLPFMMEHYLLNNVNSIQIQFHRIEHDSEEKMNKIIKDIESLGFQTKFNYPFIWYGAVKK